MPELMSTVRFEARRIPERSRFAALHVRGIATVVALSVAVFAGSFALGRAGSPASAAREQSSPTAAVRSATAAIPTRLGSAPPIALEALSPRRASQRARTLAVAGASERAAGAGLYTEAAPASVQSAAGAVPATAPEPAAASPAPAAGGAGRGALHRSGRKSFDTSG
jgi:hypothetical protein